MNNTELTLRELKHDEYLQKWIPIVNECINSGLPKQEWCRRNGINTKTYFYWQKKIFDAAKAEHEVEFVELKPAAEPALNAVAAITSGKVTVICIEE